MAEPVKTFGFRDLMDQEADPEEAAFILGVAEEEKAPEPGTISGAKVPGTGSTPSFTISEEHKKQLAAELCDILQRYDEMMEERWARDKKVEDAYSLVEDSSRTGNYPGAAQMVSEMTMSAVDQAKARIAGSILSVKPIVKVDPIETSTFAGEEAQRTADAAQDFLENYARDVLKIEEIINLAVLRATKIGTAVAYVNWKECKKKYKQYGKNGTIKEITKDVSRIHMDIHRNQDVILWPPWIQDWQEEYEIVGHRVQKTVSQWRVDARTMNLTEELTKQVETFGKGTQVKENKSDALRRDGVDPNLLDTNQGFVEYTELWCNRLLPDGEQPEKVQLFLHEGLRKILWIDNNRLHSQKHPYFPIRYKRSDDSAWGTGLGHEIVYCQAADTAFRCLEMDNLMALAFVIVLLKSGTMADAIMDRAYPGMRVPTEDPEGDVKSLSLADQGGSALAVLYQAMNQNEARKTNASGLAQVLSGQGDPTMKSGAGTGSTMALIEQAGKKFGDVDASVRGDLTPIYAMFLDLVAQFAAEGVYYTKTDDEKASVLHQLSYVPVQGTVSEYFRIYAHAPSAANNKELSKQNLLVVDQFMMQRVQLIAQMAQQYYQSVNPAGYPQFLQECIEALTTLGERVLEANEVQGIKGLMPEVQPTTPAEEQINELTQQLQQAQQQLQQMQMQAQQQADMAAGPPPDAPPEMAPPPGPEGAPPQPPLPGMA